MKPRSILSSIAITILFSAVAPRPGDAQTSSDIQWELVPGGNPIAAGQNVGLYSTKNRKHVTYGRRKYGIDLVWKDQRPNPAFCFERSDGSRAPIRFGEVLALRVAGGGYLKYGDREWGINLVWSNSPAHEWEVRGGRAGNEVGAGKEERTIVAFYNRTIRKYVVYGERTWGINLVWK